LGFVKVFRQLSGTDLVNPVNFVTLEFWNCLRRNLNHQSENMVPAYFVDDSRS
jgi:hypothetical protein